MALLITLFFYLLHMKQVPQGDNDASWLRIDGSKGRGGGRKVGGRGGGNGGGQYWWSL